MPVLFIGSRLLALPIPKKKVAGILQGALLSLLFAGLTGLLSKVRFYLPFTPVPVTGQVFAVLLAGLLLGRLYGTLSQIFYIGFGLLGISWFSVFPLIPTGGYLLGFIAAPYAVGWLLDRWERISFTTVMAALVSGIALIHLFGLVFFAAATGTGLAASFRLAVLPFIPFDLSKAIFVALLVLSWKKMRVQNS
jgi:biotin transport system substrate-specific component